MDVTTKVSATFSAEMDQSLRPQFEQMLQGVAQSNDLESSIVAQVDPRFNAPILNVTYTGTSDAVESAHAALWAQLSGMPAGGVLYAWQVGQSPTSAS